jgi:hypothetical protein
MKLGLKQISWLTLALQSGLILWLNWRSELDVFSQLVLVPLLLSSGLALLSMQQRDD